MFLLLWLLSWLLDGYDSEKKQTLIEGFTHGFVIPSTIGSDPPKRGYINHKTVYQDPEITRQKLDKELSLNRIAGPFRYPPLHNMIFSPIGLVPKKTPGEFRLIHDLSFPQHNSVNSHIDPIHSAVQYEVLDNCVQIIQSLGSGCLVAKADFKDAFRLVPVSPASYRLLGFIWDGSYFYDRCLPMGCAISCQTFESLSQALQWILVNKLAVNHVSHILDDFITFGPPDSTECQLSLHKFLSLAERLNLPIKHSKTVFPTTSVVLHGILVDTVKLHISLPSDKVIAARVQVDSMIRCKRVSLRSLQSLIGVLNFACRVIVPGRAFLRRLINLTKGVSNPSHSIRLNKEARKDLNAWKVFLDSFNGKRLCLPNAWTSSRTIKLYSDASGFGYAAIYGSNWIQGLFPECWSTMNIAIKELLPIVLAVRLWSSKLSNSRILFMTDNMSVVHIINTQTSKDDALMSLVRDLVVVTMTCNIDFRAKHVPGVDNKLADYLSRFQTDKAFAVAPWLKASPQSVPKDWLPW